MTTATLPKYNLYPPSKGHLSAPLPPGGHRGVGLLSPNYTFPADEETDYEYDQANRLTKATLPSGVEIEFEYDGIGRRLKKTITDDTGSGSEDIIETTLKYHYIGGQLTTIEIDEETTDDSDPPVETTTKDETIHIHLGPNSQPISFEWVRYDYTEEVTLDDTYWFHYDIHGNVLKVTDDTQTTKITYTYDTLGKLTTETNPDNIPNFFKFRGATQTLHDPELDLYFGGGFYRPDLGTSLDSEFTIENPSSSKDMQMFAQIQQANMQHMQQAAVAITNGGAPETKFSPRSDDGHKAVYDGEEKPEPPPIPDTPILTVGIGKITPIDKENWASSMLRATGDPVWKTILKQIQQDKWMKKQDEKNRKGDASSSSSARSSSDNNDYILLDPKKHDEDERAKRLREELERGRREGDKSNTETVIKTNDDDPPSTEIGKSNGSSRYDIDGLRKAVSMICPGESLIDVNEFALTHDLYERVRDLYPGMFEDNVACSIALLVAMLEMNSGSDEIGDQELRWLIRSLIGDDTMGAMFTMKGEDGKEHWYAVTINPLTGEIIIEAFPDQTMKEPAWAKKWRESNGIPDPGPPRILPTPPGIPGDNFLGKLARWSKKLY